MEHQSDIIKSFRETLKDAMRAKSVSAHKLAELSAIPLHYIQALIENDVSALPAAPYVRGYIHRIADILDVDPEQLWKQYKNDDNLKQSGERDVLPSNRFAHKPVNKKIILVTIIALIALAYVIPSLASFFGKPTLMITDPQNDSYTATTSLFVISGTVENQRDKVLINNEEIVVLPDGTFSKEVLLQSGQNTYTIVSHRFLGKDTSVTRTIWLQEKIPAIQTSTTPSIEQQSSSTQE